jgi:hypothetical protein
MLSNNSPTNVSCEICGVLRNLDRHHVTPKQMGGRKDPAVHDESNLMTLCRSCHRNLHEGRWELIRSHVGIRVLDKSTGEQVMRRLYQPDLDTPSIFQSLNVAEDSLVMSSGPTSRATTTVGITSMTKTYRYRPSSGKIVPGSGWSASTPAGSYRSVIATTVSLKLKNAKRSQIWRWHSYAQLRTETSCVH